MRVITITIKGSPCGYDVHENGKKCDGLSWDEMLGQVAMLTMPVNLVGKGFAMRTTEEWAAIHEERINTITEKS